MNVRPVDYRDQNWEQDYAEYRVFLRSFHRPTDVHPCLVDSYEVSDASVTDVVDWARTQAAEFDGWEVWVKVNDSSGELGVILLMSERTDTRAV